jgi:hypothetical protein
LYIGFATQHVPGLHVVSSQIASEFPGCVDGLEPIPEHALSDGEVNDIVHSYMFNTDYQPPDKYFKLPHPSLKAIRLPVLTADTVLRSQLPSNISLQTAAATLAMDSKVLTKHRLSKKAQLSGMDLPAQLSYIFCTLDFLSETCEQFRRWHQSGGLYAAGIDMQEALSREARELFSQVDNGSARKVDLLEQTIKELKLLSKLYPNDFANTEYIVRWANNYRIARLHLTTLAGKFGWSLLLPESNEGNMKGRVVFCASLWR